VSGLWNISVFDSKIRQMQEVGR